MNNPQKAKTIRKRGEEPMRQALYRMSGVDLTGIDALGVETVQLVLSEYGADLSRFPTEDQGRGGICHCQVGFRTRCHPGPIPSPVVT